jgi:hypothetical protein|tara:strand:+ start:465 stop:698 length:234 start_codon:yes stop_codon:yes gene_type:complete
LYLVTFTIASAQNVGEHLKNLQQSPPSLIPEVFAPGLVSKKTESEFGSVFNADGTAFSYGVDFDGRTEIKHMELIGD